MATEDLIQQALTEAKKGNKEGSKKILSQIVNQEPKNARAWYLLSQVVDEDFKKIYCLKKVLEIDPGNWHASDQIKKIENIYSEPVYKKTENSPSSGAQNKTKNFFIALVLVGTFTISCCVIMSWFSSSSDKGPQPTATLEGRDAFIMCLQFVRDNLKSPGSADFPYSGEANITRIGDQFTVKSYVDSQNSFGGLVRNRWTCTIKYIGNDQWKLIDMQFSNW